jgi:hypothetical protein
LKPTQGKSFNNDSRKTLRRVVSNGGLVNIQNPENRHFIKDFKLFTRSLVLVRIRDGRQEEYKVLNDTWELVGLQELMQQYVENEVRNILQKL